MAKSSFEVKVDKGPAIAVLAITTTIATAAGAILAGRGVVHKVEQAGYLVRRIVSRPK